MPIESIPTCKILAPPEAPKYPLRTSRIRLKTVSPVVRGTETFPGNEARRFNHGTPAIVIQTARYDREIIELRLSEVGKGRMDQLSDSAVSRKLYFGVLLAIRAMLRRKRRLMAPWLPDRLSDFTGLAGDANLVSIVPTIIGIWFTPRRFFGHMQENGKGAVPYSLASTKFLVQGAALLISFSIALKMQFDTKSWWITGHREIDHKLLASAALVVVALTLPLWLTSFTLIIELVLAFGFISLIFWIPRTLLGTVVDAFHRDWRHSLLWLIGFVILIALAAILPWRDASRCRVILRDYGLSPIRYLTGSVYITTSLALLLIPILILQALTTRSPGAHEALPWILAIVAIPILKPVLRLYSAMLEAAKTYPRPRLFKEHVYEINQAITRIESADRVTQKIKDFPKKRYIPVNIDEERLRILKATECCLSILRESYTKWRHYSRINTQIRASVVEGLADMRDARQCFEDPEQVEFIGSLIMVRSHCEMPPLD